MGGGGGGGVELADVDSAQDEQSMSRHRGSIYTSTPSEGGRSLPLTDSVDPPAIATSAIKIDDTSILHPFSPIRLMTIAHAFNYRMAVLRNGVKSAVRVARVRKAEGCFLLNSDIQWGQQVVVMFQIVSTMALELPSFLGELEELRGISAKVQLNFEPWGHDDHEDVDCECQASDRTAAYVHDLMLNRRGPLDSPDSEVASNLRPEPDWGKGRPGLVPFVSCRPGAYGRLLLTVYERWRMGLLVPSEWLRPVTRGGWRTGFPDRGRGSADAS